MANRGPSRETYSSIPIQTFAGYDSVDRILAVLQQLEYGLFLEPAMLADALARDDRIDAVIRTRIGAITSSELDMKPADDSKQAIEIAEMLGGTEDGPGKWDDTFPMGVLSELFRFGYLLNFGLAEIQWETVDKMWWPRLKFWDTQFVRWDWMTMGYRLLTLGQGEIALPKYDERSMGDGRWFIWNPGGYQYAWRRGMLRALASKFMMRQWSYRDFGRFCEAHGLCLVKAVVPGAGGTADRDGLFLMQVANRGSEPTVMCPQGVDGDKYDVQYVEAMSLSWKSFGDFIDRLNTDIAVLLLGQNLTTEASGGGLGGGEAKTHNLVRIDKAREDALITTAFRNQILKPFCIYNYGKDAAELAPRPVFRIGPPEDKNGDATVLKTVGDAIASLSSASDRVDEDTILEDFGIPLLTEEEAEARRQVRAEQDAVALDGMMARAAVNGTDAQSPGDNAAPPVGKKKAAKDGTSAQGADEIGDQVAKRYTFQGLPIAVENPRGSVRSWTDADGTTGQTAMLHDYGFIEGHVGNDGEEIDCYVGPSEQASHVYNVHQMLAPDFKKFDEDKVMLGFSDAESAKQAYLAHRTDARAFGGMSVVPADVFKAKLKRRKGTGKIRASSAEIDHTFAAIMNLADRSTAMRASLPARPSKVKRDYPTELTKRAVKLAAQALAPDLAMMKDDVRKATSFDDLRDRIIASYRKHMSGDELARIVQRVRLMSNLAGRLAVHQEAKG